MTTGLGQNCVTRGRGPLEIPFCKPQIGAKTETWLENSWRRSDNIVGDLEENYGIWIHAWRRLLAVQPPCMLLGALLPRALLARVRDLASR
jgi:hypothetical protein